MISEKKILVIEYDSREEYKEDRAYRELDGYELIKYELDDYQATYVKTMN